MRLSAISITVVVLAALTGCATNDDLRSIQRDLDEVKYRVVTMEKDMGGIRKYAAEEVAKGIAPYQQEMTALRKGTADIQAALESARVDMQSLTGKIDDVAILAQKPAEDIPLLREDLSRRLTALEERLAKVEKGLEELQKGGTGGKTAEIEKNPEALYQKALETLRSGDTLKGRDLFAKFIALYPKHELAANAHYWIGESYYSEKNYDQAILEFQEIIKNFPGKEKAPAAMLKQGMAFHALGDAKSTRFVLRKLIDTYPRSEEARSAKEKLKELK